MDHSPIFPGVEYNSPRHMAIVNQMKYDLQRAIVEHTLDALNLNPETDIWIYPEPFWGFSAVVGIGDKVLIFFIENGIASLVRERKCLGVRENGSLVYCEGENCGRISKQLDFKD